MIHTFNHYEPGSSEIEECRMNGARLAIRGIGDTYDNLVYFTLASLMWWTCMILIVPGPAGTIALFAHADPRIGSLTDRPSWSETLRLIVGNLWRGWRVAILTLPALVLLTYNIVFYGSRSSAIGILAPLWLLLLLIGFLITLSAFSIAALLDEQSAIVSIKLAVILVGAHLPRALVMLILLSILLLLSGVLVVPFVMFAPAATAAVINRFVLTGLRVSVPDPLAPTPERAAEAKKGRRWFGP
jgi:uncharacterized membrane protein YesL